MSERDWSVYIKRTHIKDCTDDQLREWLRSRGWKSVSVDGITHSAGWPDGWAIKPLPTGEYWGVIDNGGERMTYLDGCEITGNTIFALVARVIIVSIKHKLTMGTGA